MATWKELKRFCDNDGWTCYKITDHFYYRKQMPDGQIKKTKISFGTGEINKKLFMLILSKQLQVSKEEFNSKI